MVKECQSNKLIFPKDQNPIFWESCDDAYDVTWSAELQRLNWKISDEDKIKLIRTTGFCPHR